MQDTGDRCPGAYSFDGFLIAAGFDKSIGKQPGDSALAEFISRIGSTLISRNRSAIERARPASSDVIMTVKPGDRTSKREGAATATGTTLNLATGFAPGESRLVFFSSMVFSVSSGADAVFSTTSIIARNV